MKRKTFEFGDDLAAAFEGFCAERRLIEKQVIESLVAHFIQQDAETREKMLMSRHDPGPYQAIVVPRQAAKKGKGQKSTPTRPGSSKRSKPGEG